MNRLLNRFLLKFEDPFMEQKYGEKSFRVTQGMLKLNLLLDLTLFVAMILIRIFTSGSLIETTTLVLISIVIFLYLCTGALVGNFPCRNFLVFVVIVAINVVIMVLLLYNQRINITKLIYIQYILSSGYRVIKNLNSFLYIVAFNFFSTGFLAFILYLNSGIMTGISWDVTIWICSPILFSVKDWKIKSMNKENLMYEFAFKKSFESINKLLDNLPAGILITEQAKVTYQSLKTREFLETAAPEHTYSKLQEVKVELANVDIDKGNSVPDRDDEDGMAADRLAETDRPLSNSSTSQMFRGVGRSLPLQGLLNMILDKNMFRENFYVEIPNATFKTKSFDIFVTATSYNDTPSAIIVIIDSTIRNKRVFIEESDKYKTRVLGYISNYLKNPIHSIQDVLIHFQNSQGHGNEKILEDKLEMARANCQIISEMPNNIQILTDIANDRLVVEKSLLVLKTLLKDIIKEFHHSKRKIVQLTYKIEEGVPETINTSEKFVKAILKNLVTNSIKNTFSGYINISVELCKNRSEAVKFTVQDLGKGIPKNELEAIKKELNNTKELFKNFADLKVGLGIKVCHQLSACLSPSGEKFTIESEEGGHGTTCSFVINTSYTPLRGIAERTVKRVVFLDEGKTKKINFIEVQKNNFIQPWARGHEDLQEDDISIDNFDPQNIGQQEGPFVNSAPFLLEPYMEDHPEDVHQPQPSSSRKCPCCYDILVVDDDSFNLSVLRNQLGEKWHVKTSHNGQEALNFIKGECMNGHPNEKNLKLVITDIEMPVMGGVEFMRNLRHAEREGEIHKLPIVANTANINELQNLQADAGSFDSYLPKPFYKEHITKIVQNLINPTE